jgi:hypothetical protein
MKCKNCEKENKGTEPENLQGYCSIECREDYYKKMKQIAVKNFNDLNYFYDPVKKLLEATISIPDVQNAEYEKLLNHAHYIIIIDPLRNKVTFEKH